MEERKQKALVESGKKAEKVDFNIKKYLTIAGLTFAVICGCILVFFVIYRFDVVRGAWDTVTSVLQPVIIGMIIAYLINPIMNLIERGMEKLLKKRMRNEKSRKTLSRVIGTAGALIFFFLIIFMLIALMVPQLVESISGMVKNLPGQVDSLVTWIDDTMSGNPELAGMVEEGIRQSTDYLSGWFETAVLPDLQVYVTGFTSGIISLVKSLLNVVVGIIIAAYMLFSKEKFIGQAKKIIYAVLPTRPANIFIHNVRKSHEIFGGFISGKILDSAIIGVLCYIVLCIMKMPYSLLVSVIVGVTNIVPFFGPLIGAIPGAIIILLASPMQGLYFIIFVFILQQIDGNVIGPTILGDSTGLSQFWVIFAILVGGGLFGFAGMVLGVPTCAVIYYIITNLVEYALRKKKLPQKTEDYVAVERVDVKTNKMVYSAEEKDCKK